MLFNTKRLPRNVKKQGKMREIFIILQQSSNLVAKKHFAPLARHPTSFFSK